MTVYKTDKKKKINRITFMENLQMMLMVLPGLIVLLVFHYLPMPGIVIAFKKFNPHKGIWGSNWIGLKNFEFFFTSQDAIRTIRNTVFYSVVFLVVGLIANVTLALMLYYLRNRKATKIYNTIVIIPKFMSMVIIAFIVYGLLSPTYGLFNQIIQFCGGEGISWYKEPGYWPLILTVVYVWQSVGMGSVLYYSSLMAMDESLIEAARIDGANLKQQIRYVIIPHLVPIMTVTTILAIGGLFNGSLDLFYQIPKDQGVLYPTTDIINTYVYRALMGNSLEKSTAVNLFQSFVGMLLVVASNGVIRKVSPENSMF